MCLNIKKSAKLMTAKEDIPVYKVIQKNNKSLYYDFQYRPNTLYRLRKPLKRESFSSYVHEDKVESGFHSLCSIEDSWNELKRYDNPRYPLKLVEFVIPKGAKYYEGKYGSVNSYVSTSIRSGNLKNVNFK